MELHTKNCHKWIDVDFRKNQIQISSNLYYGWLRKTWYKIWLWIKRGKSNCSSFKQTWPRRFIGDRWLLINVSFAHMNFLINTPPCLSPFIPFSGFHLPRLRHSLASVAVMAHNSRGRFCKEEAPRPHPCPSSSVLSAALAKRVRFRGDDEEPS
jgi:hypothetical protein